MTRKENPDSGRNLSRRNFLGAASLTAFALAPSVLQAEVNLNCSQAQGGAVTGNGEWTYRVVPGWGALPAGTAFGGTHGGITQDRGGHIYISTQSETGVLVYNSDGVLIKTIASQYPEIHSIVCVEEGGEEFFYATVQKGTPRENW